MKTSRAIKTRRLYAFEDKIDRRTKWLDSEQPISVLRRLGGRIWKKHGRTKNPPELWAGRGTYYNGRYISWSADHDFVEFSRQQRNRRTCIHEMTHILGPIEHGKNFINLNIKLLVEFGRCEKKPLIEKMIKAKLI